MVSREQQRVRAIPHMPGEVLGDHSHQVRRDRDGTTTGVALGRADHEAATSPHHRTLDTDDAPPGVHVDVDVDAAGEHVVGLAAVVARFVAAHRMLFEDDHQVPGSRNGVCL